MTPLNVRAYTRRFAPLRGQVFGGDKSRTVPGDQRRTVRGDLSRIARGDLGREQEGVPQDNFNAMNDATKQWLFETFMRAVDKYGTNLRSVDRYVDKYGSSKFVKKPSQPSLGGRFTPYGSGKSLEKGTIAMEKASKYLSEFTHGETKNDMSVSSSHGIGHDLGPPIYANMHIHKTGDSYEYIEPQLNENIDYREDITLPPRDNVAGDGGTLKSTHGGPGCFEERGGSESTLTNCVIKLDNMNSSSTLNLSHLENTTTHELVPADIEPKIRVDSNTKIHIDANNNKIQDTESKNTDNNKNQVNEKADNKKTDNRKNHETEPLKSENDLKMSNSSKVSTNTGVQESNDSSIQSRSVTAKPGHLYAINISDTMPGGNDFMSINYFIKDDDREKRDNFSYNILRTILKNIDTVSPRGDTKSNITKDNEEMGVKVAGDGSNEKQSVDHVENKENVQHDKNFKNVTHSEETTSTLETASDVSHSINESTSKTVETHTEEEIKPTKTTSNSNEAINSSSDTETGLKTINKLNVNMLPLVNNQSYSPQALSYVLSLNEALSRIIKSNLKLPPASADLMKSMLVSINAFYADFKAHVVRNRTTSKIHTQEDEQMTDLENALDQSKTELSQLNQLNQLNDLNGILEPTGHLQGRYNTGITTLNELDALLGDKKVTEPSQTPATDKERNALDEALMERLVLQNALHSAQLQLPSVVAGSNVAEDMQQNPIEISIQNIPKDISGKDEKIRQEDKTSEEPVTTEYNNSTTPAKVAESTKNTSASFHASIVRNPLNISLAMNMDTFHTAGGNTENKDSPHNDGDEASKSADSSISDPVSFMKSITLSMNKLYADVKNLLPDENKSSDKDSHKSNCPTETDCSKESKEHAESNETQHKAKENREQEKVNESNNKEIVKESNDKEKVKESNDKEKIKESNDKDKVKESNDKEKIKESNDKEKVKESNGKDGDIKNEEITAKDIKNSDLKSKECAPYCKPPDPIDFKPPSSYENLTRIHEITVPSTDAQIEEYRKNPLSLYNQQLLAHFFSSGHNNLQVPEIGLPADGGHNNNSTDGLGAFIVIPVNRGALDQRSKISPKRRKKSKRKG